MKNLSLCVLMTSALVAGCGSDSNQAATGTANGGSSSQQSANQAATAQSSSVKPNSVPWTGVASGYVSNGDPSNDRVELFVRFGEILGATTVYRRRAEGFRPSTAPTSEQMSAQAAYVGSAIDEPLLSASAAIAPVIQTKMQEVNQVFAIHDLLLELKQEQQLQNLLNQDRSQRDVQQQARQKVFDLQSRLYMAITAFFPSRHEFMLASSALIREAGDKMAIAVSGDGVIIDVDLLQEAYALIDLSVKLDPKNVAFCDSQRLPMRDHKRAIDDLLNAIVPLQLGEKINVTATDAYALAAKAQVIGEGFPQKDTNQCG
ncbi:hypothetical protein [Arenicella xantha]|uniref:LPP20 lipoprotein n=1 Tax=Arenicella xantha TaxID=644221 RepID=A0A395JG86_9GAMM|nr:hypothetical protein [Arenicella xantha]RBP48741.1 hypothetical protein DFR28_10579 [Arenicella xantha]